MTREIKKLISAGVYNQRDIFNRLYPTYRGHYSNLRNEIARIKNEGLG